MENLHDEPTKRRLLEVAGRVFAEKGFRAATVREICLAAEANVAAVNYHFGDKRQLYLEAVKHAHRQRVEQFPLPEWPEDTPAAIRLRDFVRTFLARVMHGEGRGWEVQLMLREVLNPTEATAMFVQEYVRPHFELLNRILADLVPESFPLERRRLLAFSVIGQCLHYRVGRPIMQLLLSEEDFRRLQPDLLADHIASVILAALGAAPPLAAEGGKP